ncbi:Iron-dependent repressor IdeR [Polaribacter huanghezhanensis]|uniref:metal-dependent transcriptional regulator n=1 Tax=Polaribacter huanghezhanensis TaxID=1354726 RepID=UPI0026473195|nr:iron dependent repressor, metal binding and dimerization domain protein [Polaribacter huanghezhanensis]WKD85580.1 Iron-dependent repressor IdeR [Polaribacter huanghezhanensis]
MNSIDPKVLLLVFFGTIVLLYYFFRPTKGIYFLLKKSYKSNSKTVVEDILKLLYHNQISNKNLTTHDLTDKLNYNNSLLIESISKMIENELIYMDGDSYKLSELGNEHALQIVRAHRLWEKYLSEKTGFDKQEWHERAEKKEHELSIEETNKLAELLGNPKYDPHGDPIPTKSGKIALKKGVSLSTLPVKSVGKIIHIEDEPDIIYRQILAEKIHLDSLIRVVENNPNRVVFHSEGEKFILAPVVAGNITVLVLENTSESEEKTMRLSSLKPLEKAIIIGLSKECRGDNRRRLLDLGFVKGATVAIDLLNPLGDPKSFTIKGTAIALREDQASKILIKKV